MPKRTLTEKNNLDTKVAVILNELQHISSEVTEIKTEMVKKSEFEPIQKIVYAVIGLILTAVVGAIIALVVQNPPT